MSGKKRNVMLFVLLFTLLLGVIVPVQAQSDGRTKTIRVAYREDADFINIAPFEWCVVTSFYQSLQAMSSFMRFSICATYFTLSHQS